MTATPTPTLPFAELLDELRRHGFVIGLDQHLRMQMLLDRLAGEIPPERLKTHLAPIFATSREQQERFHRIFERVYPVFAEVEREEQQRLSGHTAETLIPPRPSAQPVPGGWDRIAALLAAMLVLFAVWQWIGPDQSAQPADSVTVSPGPPPVPSPAEAPLPQPESLGPDILAPQPAAPPALPPEQPAGFFQQHRTGTRVVLIMVALGLFAANEWRLYQRRRLVVSRERRQKPPFTWPVRLESPTNPFAQSTDLPNAARLLRQREAGEVARLSVEETVSATIAALGFPTFRYRTDTRAPDYLLLIERSAYRDHAARLYQALGRSLEREGVHVTRYLHDGDPRVCYSENGEQRELLVDLRRRFPDYRLLLFSQGEKLVDPVSGRLHSWTTQFLSWSDRAILTPESPATWGLREVALAQHFVVLPATTAGLMGVVGHFRGPARPDSNRWRALDQDPALPRLDGAEPLAELQRYLGPRVYRWLCACAVYPELHWDLTLHFGSLSILGPGLISEDNLLRLLRLPWFRQGAIPDEIRTRLIDQLTEAEERAVREAIVELLERNPAPGDSVSANRYELELVVQRLALHRRDPKERRAAMKELAGFPRRELVQDFAMLKLIEETPSSRLQVLLPRRMRRMFYRDGLPLLGARTAVRGGVLVAAIAGAIFLTSPSRSIELEQDSPDLAFSSGTGYFDQDTIFLLPEEGTTLYLRDRSTSGNVIGAVPNIEDAEVSVRDGEVARLESSGPGEWFLQGNQEGTTRLQARVADGTHTSIAIKVAADSIEFDEGDTVTLEQGSSLILRGTVPAQGNRSLPILATRFEVANGKIATPRGGMLFARAPGQTRVTGKLYGQSHDFLLRVVDKVSGAEPVTGVEVIPAPNQAIERVVQEYADAAVRGDIDRMQQLFPSMPLETRRRYDQVGAIRGRLVPKDWQIESARIGRDSATLIISGLLNLEDGQRKLISTSEIKGFTLARKGDQWVIAGIESNMLVPLTEPVDPGEGLQRLDSLRGLAERGGPGEARRYFAAFDTMMLRPTQRRLLDRLNSLTPDSRSVSYSSAYSLLKTYLITTAHPEKGKAELVGPILFNLWRDTLLTANPAENRLALRQFLIYSRMLQDGGAPPTRVDSAAVSRARSVLARLYDADRDELYVALVSGAGQAPEARSQMFFRSTGSPPLLTAPSIGSPYSVGGWYAMQRAIAMETTFNQSDNWVMGDKAPTEQQRFAVADRLRARYRADYLARWTAVLARAEYTRFNGMSDASTKLLSLAGRNSQLLQFITTVAVNTAVDSVMAERFASVNAMAPGDSVRRLSKEGQAYIAAMSALGVALEQASDPANRSSNAIDRVLERMNDAREAANAVVSPWFEKPAARDVARLLFRLLLEPIERVEPLISGGDAAQLDTVVGDFCDEIDPVLGMSPFKPGGKPASLDDLNRGFHPSTGSLWGLLDDQLSPYLIRMGNSLVPTPGSAMQLNPRFVGQINAMAGFSRGLYPEGQLGPRLKFSLRILVPESIRSVTLTMDDQRAMFTPSRSGTVVLEWLGIEARSATLSLNGPEVKTTVRTGTYGIFQLFAESQGWAASGGLYRAKWEYSLGGKTVEVPFEIDFLGAPPIFAPQYLQQLRCERQATLR